MEFCYGDRLSDTIYMTSESLVVPIFQQRVL